MQDAALAVILAGTVLALYVRPFRARDWQVAAAGAAAAWAIGPLGFSSGMRTLGDSANIVAFFFGLMLLAAGAEAAGLYTRAGEFITRAGTVRTRVAAVVILGISITAVLSNDATPLVLAPAIFAAGTLDRSAVRPSAYAATFVADGGSLLLPVSNPVNLLFYERFDMSFGHYLQTVTPAAFAAVMVLGLVVVRRAPASLTARTARQPASQRRTVWPAGVVVVVLATAYVVAGIAGLPLGLITLGGGIAMFAAARSGGEVDFARYRRHVAPGVLVFVASLLLLVESVERAGLLGGVGDALQRLGEAPAVVTVFGAALLAALLANLLNNWPSALLLAAAIAAAPGNHDALVAGALIGSTIGANFTVVGSLSTVFWLSLSRQAGEEFSPWEYSRQAFLPTLAALCAACLVAAALL